MRIAIFPGSFDPFTIGHEDIVRRGLKLFDKVVIGIGQNYTKRESESVAKRVETIQRIFKNEPRVSVEIYDGLTVDLAEKVGAQFLLRGVRNTMDLEYERSMAETNKELSGIETVLLLTRPELGHISSTLVRDLQSHGRDVTKYLPQ